MTRLLVVAGEPSGDAMAAPVLDELSRAGALEAAGMGGPALRASGLQCLVRLEDLAEMGADAVLRMRYVLAAFVRLRRWVIDARPKLALLVGFSEFNGRLGAWLRRRGVRVVWYAPPQVWAWRSGRAAKLVNASDAFAVVLPFEAALWRSHGARAEYVGHPALERVAPRQPAPTPASTLAPGGGSRLRVALLPGSRASEVTRHSAVLAGAARRLERERGWRCELLIAAGLPAASRERLLTDFAEHQRREGDAASWLSEYDLALVCSGTASLEAALAGTPPVIFYGLDRLSEFVLRRAVKLDHIGLPNLLLKRRAFPELVGAFTEAQLVGSAVELSKSLAPARASCEQVRRELEAPLSADPGAPPSQRVAALLSSWLS